jgi:hypothetical protein
LTPRAKLTATCVSLTTTAKCGCGT